MNSILILDAFLMTFNCKYTLIVWLYIRETSQSNKYSSTTPDSRLQIDQHASKTESEHYNLHEGRIYFKALARRT